MLERSSIVKICLSTGSLLIWGRPYKGSDMSTTKPKHNQTLEQKHRHLFKDSPEYLKPDSESLEQPYAGEVVETITTYSVYGEQTPEE
jgi:hypothetical protein